MNKVKLLFAAVLALLAFATVVSTASAFRATVARGGAISAASLGRITFGLGASPTIQCSMTLNGSLRTSAELTVGETLGSISEVRIEACSTGSGWEEVLELPWPLTVKTISRGLPDSATSLEVQIRRFAIEAGALIGSSNCLYAEEGTRIAGGILGLTDTGTNTYTTGLLRLDEGVALRLFSGTFGCSSEINLRGSFRLTPQQSLTVS